MYHTENQIRAQQWSHVDARLPVVSGIHRPMTHPPLHRYITYNKGLCCRAFNVNFSISNVC